jgi:DNA-directed RNA polymerase specialized sigma24 family protein
MPDFDADRSVTAWLTGLRRGESQAAHQLWERYFDELTRVARRRLASTPKRAFDEEDVALSVLDTVCRGAAEGRFKELSDRHDMWLLLLAITRQKAVDRIRAGQAQKRGGGLERGESVFADQSGAGLEAVLATTPDAEFLIDMDERCRHLMSALPDDTLRQVAQYRLEGHTVPEIARHFNHTTRWVERKLAMIRKVWSKSEHA